MSLDTKDDEKPTAPYQSHFVKSELEDKIVRTGIHAEIQDADIENTIHRQNSRKSSRIYVQDPSEKLLGEASSMSPPTSPWPLLDSFYIIVAVLYVLMSQARCLPISIVF